MARLPPAVAKVRVAVRSTLTGLPSGTTVLVACSGGPDSMALAAACAFVAPRAKLRAGLVTVDHQLQTGSAERATTVAKWAGDNGFDPVEVATVDVDRRRGGPEAAARQARYAALDEARDRHHGIILLGHTRDDQAETVLLALARGSGPRGIAGMPRRRTGLWRPLLDVTRADTVQACIDLGLPVWHDPHNTDPAYTRSRLRAAMPMLTRTLGSRLVGNLARTAELVAADNDALDHYAAELLERALAGGREPAVEILAPAPAAVLTRALRVWALAEGAEGDGLSYIHIAGLAALVTDWRGQGPVQLPGGRSVRRIDSRLTVAAT